MNAACELVAVTKRYGRLVALHETTLIVRHGELVGLIGPNGAGKTTMMRIAAGLLHPTTGTARRADRTGAFVRYFGGERTLPPDVSARSWMAMWVPNAGGITARRLGVLSRGTRQRIGLEATLAGTSARLLLLDEPWEGLDPDGSRWLSQRLVEGRDAGMAMLVSSHRIHELAEVCDRCDFLVRGRLATDRVVCAKDMPSAERSARLFEAFVRLRAGAA